MFLARNRRRRLLTGQVAAITGGARGIGKATAEAFVREGVKVAVGDLDVAAVSGAIALELDVSDRASFERFLSDTERELGPIDVLVNNAGILHLGEFVEEQDAMTRRVIDVNVHGVLNGMKLGLPAMIARGSGHVVNVASSAGRYGVPWAATYCGTKFFVVGVSEAVRAELRGTGVEVSCVMPVMVRTELTAGLPEPRLAKAIEPEEVAEAIVQAVRAPRFDVYVPRSLGRATPAFGLLPRRAREALARSLAAQATTGQDEAARQAYAARVAGSVQNREHGQP